MRARYRQAGFYTPRSIQLDALQLKVLNTLTEVVAISKPPQQAVHGWYWRNGWSVIPLNT
jgi:hypothetical protein